MKLNPLFSVYFALMFVLLLSATAHADEKTALDVTMEAKLEATPAEVWSVVGDYQDLSWHPAVYSLTGEGGNEVGATRVLVIGAEGGPVITEVLDHFSEEKMSYGYRITEAPLDIVPLRDYSATMTIRASDDGNTVVELIGKFNRADPSASPAPEMNDEAAVAAVTGDYRMGLDALKELFAKN